MKRNGRWKMEDRRGSPRRAQRKEEEKSFVTGLTGWTG
jgi:hypothetical protein